jgi:hypothetical protein
MTLFVNLSKVGISEAIKFSPFPSPITRGDSLLAPSSSSSFFEITATAKDPVSFDRDLTNAFSRESS